MPGFTISTMPEQYRPKGHWKKYLLVGLLLPIIAGVILWYLGAGQGPATHAARTFLQSATGWAQIDNFVSAEFPKTPRPGNLLVAVVSNSHAAEIAPPLGWFEAVNESGFTPGQAFFYKIAAQNENRVVTVSRISNRVNLGLQIFEYPGVDPANPIDMVASSAGHGRVLHSGTLSTTADKSLLISAFTVNRRENFSGLWNNDFSLRNVGQTKGGGLISFALADLVAERQGSFDTALPFDKPTDWRGQIVAFHRAKESLTQATNQQSANLSLDLRVSDEQPEPGQAITYTLTATNSGQQPLNSVFVRNFLPETVSLHQVDLSQGRYAPGAGMWEVGDLPVGATATLNLHVYVNNRTHDLSSISRASLYIMEQIDADQTDDEAYAVIDIQKVVGLERDCPDISALSFSLSPDLATTDSQTVSLKAKATGASYVLLSEIPNRKFGAYYPLSDKLEFELTPKLGQKNIYAWFMNFCQSAPIQKETVELVAAPVAIIGDLAATTDLVEAVATDDLEILPVNQNSVATQDINVATTDLLDSVNITAKVGEDKGACGIVYEFSYSMVPDDINHEVRQLQEVLQCLGFFPPDQDSTAIFGPITEQSVKDFQADHDIEPVGYVGPATIAALNQYTQQ